MIPTVPPSYLASELARLVDLAEEAGLTITAYLIDMARQDASRRARLPDVTAFDLAEPCPELARPQAA